MSNPYVKDITFDKLNEGLVSSKAVFNEDNKLNVLPYGLNKDNNSQVRALQLTANSDLLTSSKVMGGETDGTQRQLLVSNIGVLQTLDSEVFGKTSQIANQTALSNTQEQTLIANQTNGTQKSMCMGINGGTQTQLAVEANGTLVIGGGAVKTAVSSVDGSTQHIKVNGSGELLTTGSGGGGSSNLTYYTATIINSGSIGAGANTTGIQDLTTSLQKVPDDIWITATNSTLGSLDCSIEFSADGTNYFEPASMTPYNIFTAVASFKATEITLGGSGSGGDRLDPPRYIRYKLTNNSAGAMTSSLVINYWG